MEWVDSRGQRRVLGNIPLRSSWPLFLSYPSWVSGSGTAMPRYRSMTGTERRISRITIADPANFAFAVMGDNKGNRTVFQPLLRDIGNDKEIAFAIGYRRPGPQRNRRRSTEVFSNRCKRGFRSLSYGHRQSRPRQWLRQLSSDSWSDPLRFSDWPTRFYCVWMPSRIPASTDRNASGSRMNCRRPRPHRPGSSSCIFPPLTPEDSGATAG